MWKAQYFIDRLKDFYPDHEAKSTPSAPLEIRFKDIKSNHLTVLNQAEVSTYINKIHKIYLDSSDSKADIDETSAVNVLVLDATSDTNIDIVVCYVPVDIK